MGCAVRVWCRHPAVHRRRDRRSDRGGGYLGWSAVGRPDRFGSAISQQGPRDAVHVRERRGLHLRRRARRQQRRRPCRAARGCELRGGHVHRARRADICCRADGAAHDHRRLERAGGRRARARARRARVRGRSVRDRARSSCPGAPTPICPSAGQSPGSIGHWPRGSATRTPTTAGRSGKPTPKRVRRSMRR